MDKGPEVAPRASDLATAEHLGRRVAEAARRWTRPDTGSPALEPAGAP